MCLFRQILSSEVEGPFATLTSGDASHHAEPFPEIGRFSPQERAEINEVWAGRRARCLLYAPADRLLFLFDHAEAGHARSGRHYGYTVRRVRLAEGPAATRPSRLPWRPVLLAAAALLAAAVATFSGLFGP